MAKAISFRTIEIYKYLKPGSNLTYAYLKF